MVARDESGKFLKGSTGNPRGRLPKEREQRYYEILMTSVTFEDWAVIVKKAAEQARRGDAKAREWLSDHLVGKPDENMNGNLAIVVRHEGNNPDPTGAA